MDRIALDPLNTFYESKWINRLFWSDSLRYGLGFDPMHPFATPRYDARG